MVKVVQQNQFQSKRCASASESRGKRGIEVGKIECAATAKVKTHLYQTSHVTVICKLEHRGWSCGPCGCFMIAPLERRAGFGSCGSRPRASNRLYDSSIL